MTRSIAPWRPKTRPAAGGQPSSAEDQPRERLFEEPIKPGFRNFEAELVIERLGSGGEDAFRLSEQTKQTAFVNETPELVDEVPSSIGRPI